MTQTRLPSLKERYQEILGRVSKSMSLDVTQQAPLLIVVSKKQPVEAIEELYRMGQRDFGENYVQELIDKARDLYKRGCTEIRWHFIGHLQSNKVKSLIPYVAAVHTVDSEKIAHELSKRWSELGRLGNLPIFIEVNLGQEDSKQGLSPHETLSFVETIASIPNLDLQGLMCIPPSQEDSRKYFVSLRELEYKCRPHTKGMLSMGMSSDFEIAIEEGSTHIRLGTVIFGSREKKQ